MASFKDSFNDGGLNPAFWTSYQNGGTRVAVRNQQLEVLISPFDSGYAGIYGLVPYGSLIGSSFTVELRSAAQQLRSGEVYLNLEGMGGGQNRVWFDINSNNLVAYQTVDGGNSILASTPYSLAKVRFLRIREAGGITHWEYSDGGAFLSLHSRPNPIALNGLSLSLGGGNYDPEDAGAVIVIDNVNVP